MPAISGEVSFQHYFEFPPEVRMMVIDSMQTVDRCRFTCCSKLCGKEARSSKNCIPRMRFRCDVNYVFIRISFGFCDSQGFILEFEENDDGVKCMICRSKIGKLFWREDLSSSKDVFSHGLESFTHFLKLYQKRVKEVDFHGWGLKFQLKNHDFGIECLNSLENLTVQEDFGVAQFLSKLRRPLKNLTVGHPRSLGPNYYAESAALANCQQVYKVKNSVSLFDLKFTYQQMLQFSAPIVQIAVGDLTEIDVYNFIKSWQNENHKNQTKF